MKNNFRNGFILAIVLVLVLITACGAGQSSREEEKEVKVYFLGKDGNLYLYALEYRGRLIPCVQYVEFRAGGLSCDFANESGIVEAWHGK